MQLGNDLIKDAEIKGIVIGIIATVFGVLIGAVVGIFVFS